MLDQHIIVTGAAGFIGSHLVDRLLASGATVYGLDNLSRGTREHLADALANPRFRLLEGDAAVRETWTDAVPAAFGDQRFSAVFHMAANSDISAGIADPDVDLKDTFLSTHETLRFARSRGIGRFVFASSSAIYGVHEAVLTEATGPCFPISSYGAMKLASEGIVTAAVESFLDSALIIRFPNVVGGRSTHGIIYDLLRKIDADPAEFAVLGDGTQRKPYLHVSELIDAMLFAWDRQSEPVACFNVGVDETNTTVRFIAETVRDLYAPDAAIRYTGGAKGWVGDVPIVRFSTAKINALGWRPALSSDEAVVLAVREIIAEHVGAAE